LILGLFASLAANVFLLWTAASQRVRYRALVERGREAEGRHPDLARRTRGEPHNADAAYSDS
jgi:hypothetical protein